MTTNSPAMPNPTAIAQSHPNVSQQEDDPSLVLINTSKLEMELFKVEMQLSKEEESLGQLEGRLARCWIITSVSLFSLAGAIILALSLNVIYKKYIRSHFSA